MREGGGREEGRKETLGDQAVWESFERATSSSPEMNIHRKQQQAIEQLINAEKHGATIDTHKSIHQTTSTCTVVSQPTSRNIV